MDIRKVFRSYTGIIILVNVVVFILFFISAYFIGELRAVDLFALQPANFLAFKFPWTIITSMFLHAGLSHILVNMISLAFIGSFVEKLIGKKRYLGLYFVGGIFSGILFVLLAGFFGGSVIGAKIFGSPVTYAVGASGAIFALGGLLAVLTPKLKVLVFFIIPMPMWAAMIGLIFFLWLASFAIGLPVGNTAHLGGLIVGLCYGFYLKKKYPHKTKMISKYFS